MRTILVKPCFLKQVFHSFDYSDFKADFVFQEGENYRLIFIIVDKQGQQITKKLREFDDKINSMQSIIFENSQPV